MKTYKITDDAATNFVLEEPIVEYQPINKQASLNLGQLFDDKMRLIRLIRTGIPYDYFESLHKLFPFTFDEWANLLGISSKSIQRIRRTGEAFKPVQSEKILEVTEVMKVGIAFFGSQKALTSWLRTPNYALGNTIPQDLLKDSYGQQLVLDAILRMEHGIFI